MGTNIQKGAPAPGLQKLGKALEARALTPEVISGIREVAAERVTTAGDFVANQIAGGHATFGTVTIPYMGNGEGKPSVFNNAAMIELPDANQQGYIGKEYRKDDDRVVKSVRLEYNRAIVAKLKEDFGDALVSVGEKYEDGDKVSRIFAVISGESFAEMPGFKDLPRKVDAKTQDGDAISLTLE